MQYKKKLRYNVGDIIYAHSYSMKYDPQKPISEDNFPEITKLFLIIYAENLDDSIDSSRNYLVLKLTSNMEDIRKYSYIYPLSKNNFLDKQGLVKCNKIHTIDISQIKGSVGTLDSESLKEVYKLYRSFQNKIEEQLLERV